MKKLLCLSIIFAQIIYTVEHRATQNDWKPAKQGRSKIIILLAGHECDQTSGAGSDMMYQGNMHSIESILTMRMVPILKKALQKSTFTVITDSCHDAHETEDTRNKLHKHIGQLETQKHAYALELHFDTAWGKSGIIPGSKYQDTGAYIHPFDHALGREFGYFSMFHRGPNPRHFIPQTSGLTAIENGISILELGPLTKELEHQTKQAVTANNFEQIDAYLQKLAQRVVKALQSYKPR
jgi:hypothetical protein